MDWDNGKCEDYIITTKREAKVSTGKGWEKAWNMNNWEDDKQNEEDKTNDKRRERMDNPWADSWT